MIAVAAPACTVIGNVMFMVTIAAVGRAIAASTGGAQAQEHRGRRRFQVVMAMQLSDEDTR